MKKLLKRTNNKTQEVNVYDVTYSGDLVTGIYNLTKNFAVPLDTDTARNIRKGRNFTEVNP